MTVNEIRGEDMRMDLGALLAAVVSRWLRIVLVMVLLLGATFAVLMFTPKLYESSASILVEQRSNAFTSSASTQASTGIAADALMSSQIELIKSRDTLLTVIDELNLRDVREFSGAGVSPVALILQLFGRQPEVRGGDEIVLENLNNHVTVIRERDSAIISVYVRSRDPQLAATIANAIANAHVRRRTDLSLSDTAEASSWLEAEIKKLRTEVSTAETAVANYKSENDLFQSGTGTGSTSILEQQLSNIATQITSAQERKNSVQSRSNLIRGLISSGQPIDGVPDVRNSLVIQNLVQSMAALQGELAQRSSTLLPNHPTIKALTAQIESIGSQVAAEGRRVADALDAEAQAEAALEQSLNDDLARLKLSVSTASRDTVALDALERDAKAQRDLLESYLARYSDASSRTDSSSALPDVRVVTMAAPSITPVSPKTSLILGAVGFVALALQVGGILFSELMSGRAITQRAGAEASHVHETRPDDDVEAELDLFGPEHEAEFESEPDVTRGMVQPVLAAAPQAPGLLSRLLHRSVRHVPVEPSAADVAAMELDTLQDDVPAMPAQPAMAAAPPVADLGPEPAAELHAKALPELETATVAIAEPRPAVGLAPLQAAVDAPDAKPDSAGAAALELSNLAADIAIGRVRVVMLAALTEFGDVEDVADVLIESALGRGLSVATIDAGSARLSSEAGISDLAADQATFGDVVHKVSEGLAAVPWGRQSVLERRSLKPVTLIEALTDIYEVVIVTTGRIGISSSLPIFSGVEGRLVVVSGEQYPDRNVVQSTLTEAAALGYEVGQLVAVPSQRFVA